MENDLSSFFAEFFFVNFMDSLRVKFDFFSTVYLVTVLCLFSRVQRGYLCCLFRGEWGGVRGDFCRIPFGFEITTVFYKFQKLQKIFLKELKKLLYFQIQF